MCNLKQTPLYHTCYQHHLYSSSTSINLGNPIRYAVPGSIPSRVWAVVAAFEGKPLKHNSGPRRSLLECSYYVSVPQSALTVDQIIHFSMNTHWRKDTKHSNRTYHDNGLNAQPEQAHYRWNPTNNHNSHHISPLTASFRSKPGGYRLSVDTDLAVNAKLKGNRLRPFLKSKRTGQRL